LSMFGSVLPAADRIGVSTSITPRPAKNALIRRYKSARNSRRARKPRRFPLMFPARSSMLAKELHEPRLVPDLDAEFGRLVELRPGFAAGNDEAGFLRDAAGDLGAERFEPVLRLVAGQRCQCPGQTDGHAVERPGLGGAMLGASQHAADGLDAALQQGAAFGAMQESARRFDDVFRQPCFDPGVR